MKKNYLYTVLWLVLLVVIALLAMNRLPQMSLFGIPLKEVDILADLKEPRSNADPEDAALAEIIDRRADSIMAAKMEAAKHAVAADTTPASNSQRKQRPGRSRASVDSLLATSSTGNALIEDFSMGDGYGMEPYYEALDRMAAEGGVVRIAVLGDSYIEGDILTADLRMMLQEKYGGCGVGYVPVTSETYGFRRSVRHSFAGWRSYKVTGSEFDRSRETISGEYAIPDSAATVELRGQRKYYSRLDSCDRSSVYFRATAPCTVTATVDGGKQKQQFDVQPQQGIQELTVDAADGGKMGRVRWSVDRTGDDYTFYGATMDCRRGIILDCYSMRSTTGTNLLGVSEKNMMEYDRLRHYDLIVLMYGLNAITSEITNYAGYQQRMCEVIERIKRDCPGSGILVVSVGDRCERRDGEMRTMRGVLAMVKYQRLIAAEAGVAFWSLFDAMGGEGSIVKMVEGTPREANGDYTHINFLGGRRLAGYFYDALIEGKENYDND